MADDRAPKINAGDIAGWPRLLISYRTDPERIADLLPPGITAGAQPHVHLNIYQVPVHDEPERGIRIFVDADYDGTPGYYTIGYGIDQESAVFISRDMNGQPKYPCDVSFYRLGDKVSARAYHQGYTFVEFHGEVKEELPAEAGNTTEHEWWVKVSQAVGGVEKSYDFPPHVVQVKSVRAPGYRQRVEGTLTLLDSPWDPIKELLPMRELLSAELSASIGAMLSREITLAGALDPDAFWPHVYTIGGSRWPGDRGGPRRRTV